MGAPLTETQMQALRLAADREGRRFEAADLARHAFTAAQRRDDEMELRRLRCLHSNAGYGSQLSSLAARVLLDRRYSPVLVARKYFFAPAGKRALAPVD